jgi:hypothetical protein
MAMWNAEVKCPYGRYNQNRQGWSHPTAKADEGRAAIESGRFFAYGLFEGSRCSASRAGKKAHLQEAGSLGFKFWRTA